MFDYSYSGNLFYFALEYCAGGSLWNHLEQRRQPFSLQEAAPLFLQALDGLAYAHDQGLVHRDIKPQNILLTAGGVAKIADFGLAKSFEKAGLSGYTRTGDAAGTFPFMAREQWTNYKYVKPSADVWSIGATLYLMLTGKLPRKSSPGQSGAEAVMRGELISIRQRKPDIPSEVAEVIDQALTNDAPQRYPNAGAFRTALLSVL